MFEGGTIPNSKRRGECGCGYIALLQTLIFLIYSPLTHMYNFYFRGGAYLYLIAKGWGIRAEV